MATFSSPSNPSLTQPSTKLHDNSNHLDQQCPISPHIPPPTTTESNDMKYSFLNSSVPLANPAAACLIMDKAKLQWQGVQLALANEAKGIPSDIATQHKEFVKLMSFGRKRPSGSEPLQDLKMVGRHVNQPDKLDEFTWYQDMETLVRSAIQKNLDRDLTESLFNKFMKCCYDGKQTMQCLVELDHQLYRATNTYHMSNFFDYYQYKIEHTAKMRTKAQQHHVERIIEK